LSILIRLSIFALVFIPLAVPAEAADPEAGARLYQHGILASGEPLVGKGFGDVDIRGPYGACARCHRKSGFGSYEGGYYIPPITAPYMFGGRQISRDDRFRALFMQAQTAEFRHQVRRVRDRPAYDEASLARALREGVDTNGRQLEHLMPRYALSDADVANLTAYLETLSREISPGVGDEFVELATVVHADIPEARREAMLGTLQSFVDWYNKRTRGDQQLAGHSVYGSSLYTRYSRLYRLHVWEIDGPAETWRAQLAEHYERHPVFALISGQVDGPWHEVGKFADAQGIPAIFPITDLPHEIGPLGGYSVYFNAGLGLEADLIGNWLRGAPESKVIQVFDPDRPASRLPAERLRKALEVGANAPAIESMQIAQWQAWTAGDDATGEIDALVVWLDDPDPETLRAWKRRSGADKLILPAGALKTLDDEALQALAGDALFAHPEALEQAHYPERFRARAWMNTRGLDYNAEDVQYRAYYAMRMGRDSFVHLLDHYHRDYLLEVLEHQIQGSPNPGLYPDMELAPGQRFASKSGYIVEPDPDISGRVEPVADRTVP